MVIPRPDATRLPAASSTAVTLSTRAERASRRYLTDRCVITRADKTLRERDIDPVTLAVAEPEPVTVYSGACLATRPGVTIDTDRGGDIVNATRVEIRLPHDVGDIRPGDIATVTESAMNHDLQGVEWLIETIDRRSIQATTRIIATLYERTR